jgi:hypothetical protein
VSWAAERAIFDGFHAELIASTEPPSMGLYATELASLGRPVFPLQGKMPRIASAHPASGRQPGALIECRGECGQDGHGLYDATTDQAKIDQWWTRWPHANIGIAIPDGVLVLDVDPRSGGVQTLQGLCNDWGSFVAATLCTQTGGDSAGRHFYFAWNGPLRKVKRGELPGIDFKHRGGYVVAPPSIHPDTREPYVWLTNVRHRVAPPPEWLAAVLRPKPDMPVEPIHALQAGRAQPLSAPREQAWTDSIADWFDANHRWAEVLGPAGWTVYMGTGEDDGDVWHAAKTRTMRSATIRYGTLFVWSTSTPFEPSNAGDPQGYTKFHAYAVLNHNGDRKAAARHLYEQRR